MLRKCLGWTRTHRKTSLLLATLAALAFLNLAAYRQAYVMTHFAAGGERTAGPEALSFLQKVRAVLLGVRIPRPTNTAAPDSVGLAFETHRFPTARERQLEGWYCSHPQPRGLVLLFHGYAAAKSSLLNEARAFHDMGYATLLVDFQGSGGSDGDDTTIGVRESEDVAGAFAYARRRWPGLPLILYGQSMGSTAILRAVALRGLAPAALVLECPFDRLLSTVENRFTIMGLPPFPMARLLVFWGGVQHGFNGFRHNPVDYAPVIDCPVLLLQGGLDSRATLSQAESIRAAFSHHATMHVFAELGHESYLQARPREWCDCVAQFLAGRESP
jgi:alpha-beta hydrolase superfamily lysophospholipase